MLTSLKETSALASQLSSAVAVPVAAGKVLVAHSMVILSGQVSTGAVESSTVITCTHVVLLPHPSAAVQVLVIVYSSGHVPLLITFAKVTAGEGLQLSVEVAVPVFDGSVLAVH